MLGKGGFFTQKALQTIIVLIIFTLNPCDEAPLVKMRFLCLPHRRWLSADYATAMYTWFHCYEQGLKLECEQRDALAIQRAGCAVETADILLQGQRRAARDDIIRFTHSVRLLIRLLLRQQHTKQASDVACQAITSLQQLQAAGIEAHAVQSACEQLADMADTDAPARVQEYRFCASRQLH